MGDNSFEMEQILQMEPREELKFTVTGPQNGNGKICSTSWLKLKNPSSSEHRIAFKVKATHPAHYCVRPNTGVLNPGKCVDIEFEYLPNPDPGGESGFDLDPITCKDTHKFMVQAIYVPEGEVDMQMWKDPDLKIMATIIECKFEKEGQYENENREQDVKLSTEDMILRSVLNSWKKQVVEKLIDTFKEPSDQETLARVMWYLSDEEEKILGPSATASANPLTSDPQIRILPGLQALQATIEWDGLFIHYAKRLADDTREIPERNAAFLQSMKIIAEEMEKQQQLEVHGQDELVSASDDENENATEKFVFVRGVPDFKERWEYENKNSAESGPGLTVAVLSNLWALVQIANEYAVIRAIPVFAVNRQLFFALEEIINAVERNRTAGLLPVALVGLAGVCLSIEAIKNLYHWWGGQITGKRCAKNLVDATFMVGGGVLGGIGGAALGSAMCGPFGTAAGGIIGGIVSSRVLHALAVKLTLTLFDLPKDAALENAYNYLGVSPSATNEEINAAFRKKCLQHHPDKGGKSEDFILLQANMAVIKLARGELL